MRLNPTIRILQYSFFVKSLFPCKFIEIPAFSAEFSPPKRKSAPNIPFGALSLSKNFVFRQADPNKNAPMMGFFRYYLPFRKHILLCTETKKSGKSRAFFDRPKRPEHTVRGAFFRYSCYSKAIQRPKPLITACSIPLRYAPQERHCYTQGGCSKQGCRRRLSPQPGQAGKAWWPCRVCPAPCTRLWLCQWLCQ